jgi:hypothetical protein
MRGGGTLAPAREIGEATDGLTDPHARSAASMSMRIDRSMMFTCDRLHTTPVV